MTTRKSDGVFDIYGNQLFDCEDETVNYIVKGVIDNTEKREYTLAETATEFKYN